MTIKPRPSDPAAADLAPADLSTLVEQLRSEVADLRARLDRQESRRTAARDDRLHAQTTAGSPIAEGSAPTIGRRRALLGLAGAAAAGTVGALASASPSAAADGDPILLGAANATTGATGVVVGDDPQYGFAVTDGAGAGPLSGAIGGSAVAGVAVGSAFRVGVSGVVVGNDGHAGVEGRATGDGTGVLGESLDGAAVWGLSETGIAGQFQNHTTEIPAVVVTSLGIGVGIEGDLGHLYLHPVEASPVATGAEGSPGTVWVNGEVTTDATAWMCVAPGNPGTWRKLAGPDTAGSLHLLPTPVRVYDSRPGGAPAIGPKTPLPAGNVARTIDLKANGSTVPAGATGALVTVLLLDATPGDGNVTIWANGRPKPSANTLVWGGDAGRFSTLAVTAVDAQARVRIDARLRTDVALDVVGYYR